MSFDRFKHIIRKINHRLIKLRLQPIRVFCFHEVSDNYADESPDWMPLNTLKQRLLDLQQAGYEFISTEMAYKHIKCDCFRTKKYAVLTADDGLRCQLDLLPWLFEHHIPITMFLNPNSLELNGCGKPYRNWYHINTPQQDKALAGQLYMSRVEWAQLDNAFISFGSHGVKHDESATEMDICKFERDVQESKYYLSNHPRFVPFYAYTYGAYNIMTNSILKQADMIPVLSDGQRNYNDASCIHREILEYEYKQCLQK